MDASIPDWNTDVGSEFPVPLWRKSIGLENELVELLWQNGEIVLHTQSNRKSKQIRYPNGLIKDDETSLWIDCPIDNLCSDFLSEIPSLDEHKNQIFPASQIQDLPPPPRFHAPIEKQALNEGSIMTVGSSHCASNQVDMSCKKVSERVERENPGQAITSCSGGSASSLWKTSTRSNDTSRHNKRKSRDESECPSDATESELAAGNKATRRSRVAEVHNLSERRRRDRINEKMRALQELIPHANKSDKASMLDEAIEYMKSLQLQIQFMWMARGMAPMMIPGMQHYMSRFGMGIGQQMLPGIHNLVRNQAQAGHNNPMLNQMQNLSFQEQYANYMAFHSMQNASPQATNMFNFGLHSAQSAAEQTEPNGN